MMNSIKRASCPALSTVLALVLALGIFFPIAEATAQGEPYMELLRTDLQTDKIAIMTAALELTEQQGEVFWPIYREYQMDLSTLGDRKIAQIKDFAASYENMSAEKASELAKTSFDIQEKQLKLLKKTHKKVSKAIDPIVAGRFYQVENVLLSVINLQISSELPLVK